VFLRELETLKTVKFEANTVQGAVTELTGLAAKRDQLAETYNTVKASLLTKLDAAIPTGPGASALLSDLDAIAKKDGVTLKSVDFADAVPIARQGQSTQKVPASVQIVAPQQGVQILPIKLVVIGRYDAFRVFLRDLELDQRLMDVTTLNFGSSIGDQYQFSIQANTYYQY
jgi:Tfp pilus assembly protein PilO